MEDHSSARTLAQEGSTTTETFPERKARLEQDFGIRTHWKCMLACTFMSLSAFQFGLEQGIIGTLPEMPGFLAVFGDPDPESPLGVTIGPVQAGFVSSLPTLGAFILCAIAGNVGNVMGRREAVALANIVCIVAVIMQMGGTSLRVLYAARLILGFANGLYMVFSQLYIHETTPARYRGLGISSFLTWSSVGGLVAGLINNSTATLPGRQCYLIPLGILFIVPGLMLVGVYFIPESPRWLMERSSRRAKARAALRWLRPYSDDDVDAELNDISEAMGPDEEPHHNVSPADIFKRPLNAQRTILGILAMTCQGGSGAMYMIMSSSAYFTIVGVTNSFNNTIIMLAISIAAILVNCMIVTHIGYRRRFLAGGLLVCAAMQLASALVYQLAPPGNQVCSAIVALSIVYVIGYNGLVATYAWLSGAEIPSQRLRSLAFGQASAVGFVGDWLIMFTAPYFVDPAPPALNWGLKYCWIWTAACIICAIWVTIFLPELKGRTLEEIDEMFENRIDYWRFRDHVCVGKQVIEASQSANVVASEEAWAEGKVVTDKTVAMVN